MIAPLLLALATSPFSAWGQAVDVGRPTGFINDRAGLFTPTQRKALEERAQGYASGTGHEIVVLAVENLGGRSLEDFALEVARSWKLGQEDLSDGALLVIDVEGRGLRIEVGRGLEGELTDLWCARIIREILTPAFKTGDYYGGVDRALETMHAIIGGESAPPNLKRGKAGGGQLFVFGGLMFLFLMRSRGGGRGPGGRLRRGGPVIFMPGGGFGSGSSSGGGFGGFGGGGGFSGGGASGGW